MDKLKAYKQLVRRVEQVRLSLDLCASVNELRETLEDLNFSLRTWTAKDTMASADRYEWQAYQRKTGTALYVDAFTGTVHGVDTTRHYTRYTATLDSHTERKLNELAYVETHGVED